MKRLDLTPEESIEQNLNTYCLEVGSAYEQHSIISARRFIDFIGKSDVIDMGSGDGAGTNVFVKNGNKVTAVDINPNKLKKIKGAKTICKDFMEFLNESVDSHVFFHHALEHYSHPEDVLRELGKQLAEGHLCYIAVPYGDTPHSVHHVAFESHDELVPPNTRKIFEWTSYNEGWPEIGVIVKK